MTPPFAPLADRAVASQDEPDVWKAARPGRIGASDAARFARIAPASIESYVRGSFRTWTGDVYADRGHYWEAPALAAYGFERNPWMFRSLDNPRHVFTPDGIRATETGLQLAEGKATMHVKLDPAGQLVVPPAHYRQMQWAMYCAGPTALTDDYIVVPLDRNGQPTRMLPYRRTIPRDEAKIADLLAIAALVLPRLIAAEAFRQEIDPS